MTETSEYKKYDITKHTFDPKGKVYIGIPRERMYIPEFVDNRDSLVAFTTKADQCAGYFQASGHRVDRNRDRICFEFMKLKTKPEWLLMIDSDMIHPEELAIRLTAWQVPIVGGLYFHRGKTHDPFAFTKSKIALGSDMFQRERQQWLPKRDEVWDFLKEHGVPDRDGPIIIGNPGEIGLHEVDAVATGAMLIHRSVLEHMPTPWFEYRKEAHSEDLIFCDEAKYWYDIPVYCDFSTISGHMAWQAMGHTQFRQMYVARGVNLSLYTINEISSLVSEHFEMDVHQAKEEIGAGNAHMVGSYWRSKNPTTDAEVREFYKDPHTGWLYLIELIHWNVTNVFAQFKQQLLGLREGMKVLELGSGIGSMSIQLAIQGCEVISSEVNKTLRDFSKFRWDVLQNQLGSRLGTIKFVSDAWKKTENGTLDAIVATDVIEHLPKEDAKKFVEHVGRLLKPGGQFHYHANWFQQDLYPMHFDYEDDWSGWLAENGLIETSSVHAFKSHKPKSIHPKLEVKSE